MHKTVLITGVTGQDGSYLAEHLLGLGYYVVGLTRRVSVDRNSNLCNVLGNKNFCLEYGDVTDVASLYRVVQEYLPEEIYNLAAQSDVGISFKKPEYTMQVVGVGAMNVFQAAREIAGVRVYQAGSSEMFGGSRPPQNEETKFYPKSPYAVAKVAAHNAAVNFRESYGMFICNGILFNHESLRRGLNFVTQKVAHGVAQIVLGNADKIELGNIYARRDWGYAPDYVKAMHLMLQQDKPSDYVVATGQSHSIGDLLDTTFKLVGIEDWIDYVQTKEENMRPSEVNHLLGDPSKAKQELGWEPTVTFEEMIKEMLLDIFARNEKSHN